MERVGRFGNMIGFFDEGTTVVIPIDKIQGRRVELGGYVFDEWIRCLIEPRFRYKPDMLI